MDPSKAVELMQIYIAEHWREMTPDDVTAHAQAIGALMAIELGAERWGIAGVFNLLMGARRAKNMLIRGGDLISCKLRKSQQIAH